MDIKIGLVYVCIVSPRPVNINVCPSVVKNSQASGCVLVYPLTLSIPQRERVN